MYNAVPLPPSLATSQAPEPSGDAGASSTTTSAPQSAAQQRLAQLKSRMQDARRQNHKAVVAEDRRDKLGEAGLKAERQQKADEQRRQQQQERGGDPQQQRADAEAAWLMETTAAEAEERRHKADKKQKRRAEHGWDVFNNEAQYRHYKKQVRRAEADGRAPTAGELADGAFADAADADADADPLAYGQAPPVPRERVQALVEDMHESALRRASWSRRRTFDEDADVTSINKRNEVYNKKIERAFDPYTAEIKANLERGTAL